MYLKELCGLENNKFQGIATKLLVAGMRNFQDTI